MNARIEHMAIDRPRGVINEAFLGDRVTDEAHVNAVVTLARRANTILRPIDTPSRINAENRAGVLIGDITGNKYRSVNAMVEAQGKVKTLVEQTEIERQIQTAGQVVYWAMATGSGGITGTPDYVNVMNTGNVAEINRVLPKPFQGLGREVRNNMFPNTDIQAVLDQLDLTAEAEGWDVPGMATVDQKRAGYQQARMALIKANRSGKVPAEDAAQLERVLGYLNVKTAEVVRPVATATGSTIEPDEAERRALELQYYRDQMGFQQNLELVSEAEWLDGLMAKDYEKAQIPSRWTVKPPEWIKKTDSSGNVLTEAERIKEWRSVYAAAEGLSYAVVQRRRDTRFGTDVEYVKNQVMSQYLMSEKRLRELYTGAYGFRQALETVMEELFTETPEGIFVFKTGKKGDGTSVGRFLNDACTFKEDLAVDLAKTDRFKDNVEQAKIMVSLAFDFLEMGGQFELADTGRDVGYASDALRTAMRPYQKFGRKIGGGEIWGGPMGQMAMVMAGNDKVIAKGLIDSWGLVPELLSGSVLNLKVETSGGQMPIGRALIRGVDIDFKQTDADFYFKWKKDQVGPACDMWQYISGKKPLEFKSLRETEAIITAWRGDLVNAYNGLKAEGDKLGVHFVDERDLAAAIAGSAAIWPFEASPQLQKEGTKLYLRVHKQDESINDPTFYDSYVEVSTAIVRSVATTPNELNFLLKYFGVTRKGSRDLYLLAVDYDYVTNPRGWYKDRKRKNDSRGWHLMELEKNKK